MASLGKPSGGPVGRSVTGLVSRHFMLDSGELREISSFDELKGVYFL
jgi:hypothetical protein